jgi:hypothetical protein
MINLFLSIFIILAFIALVYLIATNETTPEEEKEMLDSDEMFP